MTTTHIIEITLYCACCGEVWGSSYAKPCCTWDNMITDDSEEK